jgi:photosystem II stability/assembly factor-like uncharacterized protein
MEFPDQEARLGAASNRMAFLRRRRAAIAGGGAAALLLAVVLPLALSGGSSHARSVQVLGPSTTSVPGTVAQVPVTTSPAATSTVPASVVPTTRLVTSPTSTSSSSSSSVPAATTTTVDLAGSGTWTSHQVPTGDSSPLNAVACPSATECLAVSGDPAGQEAGTVLASSDGGATWTIAYTSSAPPTSPASGVPVDFDGIACPSTSVCVAIGTVASNNTTEAVAEQTTDGGHTWSQLSLPGTQISYPTAVACVSAQTCLIAGSDTSATTTNGSDPVVIRTTDGGSTWSTVSVPSGMAQATSLWCSTTDFCLLGGAGPGPTASSKALASTSHDGGVTWSAPVTSGDVLLASISCANAHYCVGVDGTDGTNTYGIGELNVTDNAGTTWTAPTGPSANSVSCTADMCLTVGATYTGGTNYPATAYLTTNGTNWVAVTPRGLQGLSSVACPTSTHCVAVGSLNSPVIVTYSR